MGTAPIAPPELATRIDDAAPKAILTASCGIEFDRVIPYKPLVDQGIALADHRVEHVVVLARPQCAAELLPERLDWYKTKGCFTEIIRYRTRLFVPVSKASSILPASAA